MKGLHKEALDLKEIAASKELTGQQLQAVSIMAGGQETVILGDRLHGTILPEQIQRDSPPGPVPETTIAAKN